MKCIYDQMKRIFDIVISAITLALFSPIFGIMAIAIKISSPGPVFHISQRVGKNGGLFRMYKFRSMHMKDPNILENSYLVNTTRIFPFGKFLRKSKLDELPQMINVLCGHMSLVGPRPYPQSVVDRLFIGKYKEIITVKPGLACLDSLFDYSHGDLFISDAQYYKENIIPVRTELAVMYARNRSLSIDVYCILRTIILMIQIVLFKKKKFQLTKYERSACIKIKNDLVK